MKKHTHPLKITPDQILVAYQHGMFPMARGKTGEIHWYTSDPRALVPLDECFTVRRSLQKFYQKHPYRIELNTDFPATIRACARHEKVGEDEVWLSDEMVELYVELHRRGHAHSVEVWDGENLVGGLYGIAMRSAFFGESMFSRVPYASQLALLALVEHLRQQQYLLLDAQVMSPHLRQFGAYDVSHEEYWKILLRALREDRDFLPT
jgi:leucyl/phenylalanyl-tRNA---protein transferase